MAIGFVAIVSCPRTHDDPEQCNLASSTTALIAEVGEPQNRRMLEMPCPVFLSDNRNGDAGAPHLGSFENLVAK